MVIALKNNKKKSIDKNATGNFWFCTTIKEC